MRDYCNFHRLNLSLHQEMIQMILHLFEECSAVAQIELSEWDEYFILNKQTILRHFSLIFHSPTS
jgi:hypothetical protein